MNSASLYRMSAVAGVTGGGAIVVLDLAQIVTDIPQATLGIVELPITLLILFALPGLYLVQAMRAGATGLLGFVLTFAGVALGMGHFYLMAFVRGTVSERWPEATDAVSSAARVVAPAELLTFVLGWILFGVTTMRAGVLPRIPAALLVVGVVLVLVRPLLPIDGPVGGVVIGIGVAWLSAALYLDLAPLPATQRAADLTT